MKKNKVAINILKTSKMVAFNNVRACYIKDIIWNKYKASNEVKLQQKGKAIFTFGLCTYVCCVFTTLEMVNGECDSNTY